MTIIKIAVYEDVYFDLVNDVPTGSFDVKDPYVYTMTDAKEFCAKFNARNTAASAPDWYMVASYEGRVV